MYIPVGVLILIGLFVVAASSKDGGDALVETGFGLLGCLGVLVGLAALGLVSCLIGMVTKTWWLGAGFFMATLALAGVATKDHPFAKEDGDHWGRASLVMIVAIVGGFVWVYQEGHKQSAPSNTSAPDNALDDNAMADTAPPAPPTVTASNVYPEGLEHAFTADPDLKPLLDSLPADARARAIGVWQKDQTVGLTDTRTAASEAEMRDQLRFRDQSQMTPEDRAWTKAILASLPPQLPSAPTDSLVPEATNTTGGASNELNVASKPANP